jgi:hypothetical protein
MATDTFSPARHQTWAFFFLYAVRRVTPLALILYMAFRFSAWRDPVVIPAMLIWVAAILSFRAAIRYTVKRQAPLAPPATTATQQQSSRAA